MHDDFGLCDVFQYMGVGVVFISRDLASLDPPFSRTSQDHASFPFAALTRRERYRLYFSRDRVFICMYFMHVVSAYGGLGRAKRSLHRGYR